jgi:hypothetical protein
MYIPVRLHFTMIDARTVRLADIKRVIMGRERGRRGEVAWRNIKQGRCRNGIPNLKYLTRTSKAPKQTMVLLHVVVDL